MSKLNLGIIGLGYIGKVHLTNATKLSNCRLIAASDVSKRALANAKNAGVRKTYTSYEQLLRDPEVDAVIIALPTHLHKSCAVEAAEAKKHIFLEKPIAKNPQEAKEIIAAAEKNSVKLMVGYPLRFNKIMIDLREKLKAGTLGDVEVAYATNVSSGPFFHRAQDYAPSPVPEWWFNKELTGGGVLIDLGSHMINILRWFFGEIKDIKSNLGYRFNLDLEDRAICLAQFESGTTAIVNVGWYSQEYQLKVEMLGTVKHGLAWNVPPNRVIAAIQLLATKASSFSIPYINELGYFVNCIINDRQPSPTGLDGLRDIEAITRAYQNQIVLG